MGVLDNVIAWKAHEDEKRNADLAAIGPAVQSFIQNRNQSMLLELERQKTQAQIANWQSETSARKQSNDLLSSFLKPSAGTGSSSTTSPYIDSVNLGGLSIKVPQTEEQKKQVIADEVAKTKALEAAKPVDATQAGRLANINSALGNRDELLGILFPKNSNGYDTTKFNPEVSNFNPLNLTGERKDKHQRLATLLKEVSMADALTRSTRGINGETVPGKSSLGGIPVNASASAFYKDLMDFYNTAQDTAKNIDPALRDASQNTTKNTGTSQVSISREAAIAELKRRGKL